jgi:phage shock protein A
MSDMINFDNPNPEPKSFWQKPEGVTGVLVLLALLGGGAFFMYTYGAVLVELAQNTLYLTMMLLALGAIAYMVLDPKMRNLIWYMYKSVMRKVTGVFVNIDPIGILKNYVEDLRDKLADMRKQIGALRGQMRKMKTLIEENTKEIDNSLKLAAAAKDKGNEQQLLLSTRKAARLKESNEKYQVLLDRMQVMYRILNKMHDNSEILLADTTEAVKLKEQERKAIRSSHSAMRSAMSVISGDPDKRAMFDMAMEAVADDVANKVGEMERFMEMSSKIMDSVDLQQGVFEEEGLKMLEKWEKESSLFLMSGSTSGTDVLDLNEEAPVKDKQARESDSGKFEGLFD